MAHSILKGVILLSVIASLAACGNVRFSAKPSSSNDSAGVPTDNGGDGRDPGDDGNGGVRDPGGDGGSPGSTPPPGGTPVATPPISGPRTVEKTITVQPHKNQVDFLLIIDDSGSMKPDQLRLARNLAGFAQKLSALAVDWQMCLTVTRDQKLADGRYVWGASIPWQNKPAQGTSPGYILKKGLTETQLNSIFTATIDGIGAGNPESGDERGIKAAYHHFYNGDPNASNGSGCYRKGSSVAVILISDEDERSVGGEMSRLKAGEPANVYRALESTDLPETLLTQANFVFGAGVKFSFNSIIVADAGCEQQQDTQQQPDGTIASPSHEGKYYKKISQLTNGGVASICGNDQDYANNLVLFSQVVQNSTKTLTLECAPVAGSLQVKIDNVSTSAYTLNQATITFNNEVLENHTIYVKYNCSN